MKNLVSPWRLGLLAGAVAALVGIAGPGEGRPPQGTWVMSGVDDCGPDHICVKWELHGVPPEDQCCILPEELHNDDPRACLVHLRHDIH